MITLRRVGTLPVSAASGLARLGERLYVVADDELHLVSVDLDGQDPRQTPLLPGELPSTHRDRKAQKPDFESLATLPDGRLLALGSGSTERRTRAVLVTPGGPVRVVECAPLFDALAARIPELNLEGATVHGDRLVLAQRGNGAAGVSALIVLELAEVQRGLEAGVLSAMAATIVPLTLPSLDGVPLTPTDLASDGTDLWFTAAAEDSRSTYEDGAVVGSAIGRMRLDGTVLALARVSPITKLEGLTLGADGRLHCVSDPDDRAQAAPLFVLSDAAFLLSSPA